MSKLVLTPKEVEMIERSQRCEKEIVDSLNKYNCRLGVKDIIVDGRIIERTISPVPLELPMPKEALPNEEAVH